MDQPSPSPTRNGIYPTGLSVPSPPMSSARPSGRLRVATEPVAVANRAAHSPKLLPTACRLVRRRSRHSTRHKASGGRKPAPPPPHRRRSHEPAPRPRATPPRPRATPPAPRATPPAPRGTPRATTTRHAMKPRATSQALKPPATPQAKPRPPATPQAKPRHQHHQRHEPSPRALPRASFASIP